MIEDAPIVKDTRRVRSSISEKFANDPDRYIDYLLSQKPKTTIKSESELKKEKEGELTRRST
ncbi:MAG: hypothetical protein A3G93_13085 [Nitrospinae bacterium RIFCSPLOWO2_12_FULL_45_22]|nr:MAG: hypothetical protein A3G93_13085 [Nitrospinae bacterium RIFCSPLOWO2_12_FULL_45_22]